MVEINAGKYYLRALRADDRIDDRQTIIEAFTDPESRRWMSHVDISDLDRATAYITRRAQGWAEETRFSWAVAEPTTGDLLGEVLLKNVDFDNHTAEAGCWAHPSARGRGMTTEALGAVLRFGFGALGLREVFYKHHPDNLASRRVAEKLGFTVLSEDAESSVLVLRNA
ncbi:Protein N-acetyltransferase, RimJ/RimL family [Actinokineospora alba]|uniref:Protein N-acetyltransferase, RimJ/RimL family n=1 Tax=Actinokineospora alba TaxID=504798 RepID=A0A1H0WG93_9PSEU|nr:GNAT family N-acetyltransferase [Actinokineospora alba]TDP65287.1 RimJ/RimL family protein N-acetyltransferase [Actinokineospora alba]SDH58904.1 Protein N-acetyltransferase, RimJ/RimL family [Actinokineospora alba]SDP89515.1 Protein N-acetyltransferase, RimJ/RimL family [Actinokineospora alba]